MGRAELGPEFHVNFGSGRVGSLYLWIGLSSVKKIGPTCNSNVRRGLQNMLRRIVIMTDG